MAKRITPAELGDAIAQELTMYHRETQERVNQAGRKAIQELKRLTRKTAPVNARVNHRHYVSLIDARTDVTRHGDEVHTWYVKAPGHRLTHLLVDGHETRSGGRTKADPFLANALAVVLPVYEDDVREAVKP